MIFYYFVVASIALVILVITIVVVVGTAKRVKADGRGDIKPIEYNAPDNLNSAEVGYIYRGSNSILDTISLLPFLASKGYIEISNMEYGQKKSETDDDKIYILKKYDGENVGEKTMMEYLDGICIPTDKKGALKEISVNEVKEDLSGMDSVIGWRINKELDSKIFCRKFKDYVWAVNAFFVVVILSVLMLLFEFSGGVSSILAIPFFGFMLILCVSSAVFVIAESVFGDVGSLISFNGRTVKKSKVVSVAFGILCGVPFGVIPIVLSLNNAVDIVHNCCEIGLYLFGFCCGIVIIRCIERIRRTKSEYGKEVYGKICGFREYLEKVEKDKIETLVKEDPKLCYKMISFAYVLGVSRDWVSDFEVGINSPS